LDQVRRWFIGDEDEDDLATRAPPPNFPFPSRQPLSIFRAPMPVVINILLAIHVVVSLLIVLIVLMQRPKNEGLGAAFGGGMTDNLFGAQTTNVLQTITRWLGGIFFLLTLLLSVLYVKQAARKSGTGEILRSAPAVQPATPAPELPSAASPPVQVTDTPSTAAPALEAAPPADAKAPAETPKPAAPAPAPAEAPKPADAAPAPAAPAPAPAPADAAQPAAPSPAPAAPASDTPKPAAPPAPQN
jgi:protein translocase SecG subunit